MAWLDDNPPRRSQFRRGRRAQVRPVIVGHTAENAWPASDALGVLSFVRNRTTPGSYHMLADEKRLVNAVDLNNEAYHDGTGSNPWSYGVSGACRTIDWKRMPAATRARFLRNMALGAAKCNAHCVARTGRRIEPRRITRAQSEAGVSGFIPHGDRDPGRRTDWGTTSAHPFPWAEFFDHYRRAIGVTPAPPSKGFLMALSNSEQRELLTKVRRIDQNAENAVLEGRKHHESLAKVLRQIRAWVRLVAELAANRLTLDAEGKLTETSRSPADLAKRADQLNK